MQDRFKIVVLALLLMAGIVFGAEIYRGVEIAHGSEIYGFEPFGDVIITLVQPPNGYSQNHNTLFYFTANVYSVNPLTNSTLYVWNSSGVYLNYLNTTSGNGTKDFNYHSLVPGSYVWGVQACDDSDCYWSSNYTLSSVDYTPTVVNVLPIQNESIFTPVTFECNSTALDGLKNTTLVIKNPGSFNGSRLHYKMDEASGDIIDYSGYGNNGNYTGSLYHQPGVFEYSIGFDGNDLINAGNDSSLSIVDDITISAWVKTSSGSFQAIVGKYQDPGPWSYFLWVSGNKVNFGINSGVASQRATSTSNINDGEWHYIVGTYDKDLGSENIKIYFDGVEENTQDNTEGIAETSDIVTIGSALGGYYLTGDVDSVGIWNRVLSETEIGNVYSNSRQYYNDNSTTNGIKTFSDVSLTVGNYSWDCEACDVDGNCTDSTDYNLEIITQPTVETEELGGQCLTRRGYSFQYTASVVENNIVFNLTNLGDYVLDDMRNVWVETAPTYIYDTKVLGVDTSDNKTITLWIAGHDLNVSRGVSTPSIDDTIVLDRIENFTRQNHEYWVNYKYEENNTNWSFSESTTLATNVFCDTYATDTIDVEKLKSVKLLLFTREHALFKTVMDSDFDRVYETKEVDYANVTVYLLPVNDTTCDFDFTMFDYTGDFQDAYVLIQSNIYDVPSFIDTIWQEQLRSLIIENVELKENDFYKIRVESNNGLGLRDIAWFEASCNDTSKHITITEPIYQDASGGLDGVTYGFTSDFGVLSLGFAYNVSLGSVGLSSFTVYLQNSSGYYQVYTANSTGATSASYSTTVDANETYMVEGRVLTSEYGELQRRSLVSMVNRTKRYIDLPDLPSTILGEPQQTVFDIVIMIMLVYGGLLLGMGFSAHAGLFMGFGAGLAQYMGFFSVPWPIVLFAMVIAVLNYLVEDRGKIE